MLRFDTKNNMINVLDYTIEYKNGTIIIRKNGKYVGCDGKKYPYTAVFVEGSGIKDIWRILKYLTINCDKSTCDGCYWYDADTNTCAKTESSPELE
jgi:hypothetical protein